MPGLVRMAIPPYFFPGALALPCKIEHNTDEGGLIISWTGNVDEQEMILALREQFTPLERFAKFAYVLADCSGITESNIGPKTVQTIAQICNQVASFNKNLYFVWAMSSDLLFALGRMWQSYTDDGWNSWHSRITRSRQEAEDWLRKNMEGELVFGSGYDLPPAKRVAN